MMNGHYAQVNQPSRWKILLFETLKSASCLRPVPNLTILSFGKYSRTTITILIKAYMQLPDEYRMAALMKRRNTCIASSLSFSSCVFLRVSILEELLLVFNRFSISFLRASFSFSLKNFLVSFKEYLFDYFFKNHCISLVYIQYTGLKNSYIMIIFLHGDLLHFPNWKVRTEFF